MSTLGDIRALGYQIDSNPDLGLAAVRGFGVATMLDPKDQAAIDALANPAAHAERRFQFSAPDAAAARTRLQAAGYTVTRVDASCDTFTVTPQGSTASSTMTPAQLVATAAAVTPAVTPA
jgi:hypothetical protein